MALTILPSMSAKSATIGLLTQFQPTFQGTFSFFNMFVLYNDTGPPPLY